jgi:hypothetical protein
MRTAKKLALIAAGYAPSVAGGVAAVAVNELRMPADIAQTSPGMVAFGDMILFVLVAGFLSLVPTWFLLKLLVEKAPRALLATELLIAAMGPVSWLAMIAMAVTTPAGGPSLLNVPQAAKELLGLLIAFGAIPRIVVGPVLVVIEGVTFFLVREGTARALLAAAMLMDLIPLGIYALHLARAGPRLDACQRCSGAAPGH